MYETKFCPKCKKKKFNLHEVWNSDTTTKIGMAYICSNCEYEVKANSLHELFNKLGKEKYVKKNNMPTLQK